MNTNNDKSSKVERYEPLDIPALRWLVPASLVGLFLLVLCVFHAHHWSGKLGVGLLWCGALVLWLVDLRRASSGIKGGVLLVVRSGLRPATAFLLCALAIVLATVELWEVWRAGPGAAPGRLISGGVIILLSLSCLQSASRRIYINTEGINGLWTWDLLEWYEWTGNNQTLLKLWPVTKPSFWKNIGFRENPLVLSLTAEQKPAMIALLDQFMPGKQKP